jgi:hypothetical protein
VTSCRISDSAADHVAFRIRISIRRRSRLSFSPSQRRAISFGFSYGNSHGIRCAGNREWPQFIDLPAEQASRLYVVPIEK